MKLEIGGSERTQLVRENRKFRLNARFDVELLSVIPRYKSRTF